MTLIAALLIATNLAPQITVTPGVQATGLHPIAYTPAPTGAQFIASMEDGSVRIMDAKSGSTVRNLTKHTQPAYGLGWSKDGQLIVTGDETGRVWLESPKGVKLREFRTHSRGIQRLSINFARTNVATTGRDDQIHILNLKSADIKPQMKILGSGANFYGGSYSPTSLTMLCTAALITGGARSYNGATGKVSGFLTGHDGQGALCLAYNPTGTRIATGGKDGTVALYDGKTLKKIASFKGHGDWVMDLAFSKNGRLLASSSTDKTVKVWDTKAMVKVADLQAQSFVGSPVCFTADGASLVTVSDQGFLQFNKVSPPQK